MLITLLILLLVSSAVKIKRDKSIIFSRVVTQNLLFSFYLVYYNLYTSFSINTYINNMFFTLLIYLIIICLINLHIVRSTYLFNRLFSKEILINFGLNIFIFICIKMPASIICSELNTPWLYLIILGTTSVLSCIIIRNLWDRKLHKGRQLIIIALLPVFISVISQLLDIDLIYAFCLILSSVITSLGLPGYSITVSYMNPSGGTGGSEGQENSGGESRGRKRVRSDSSEKGYPNRGWTSVNKPVGSSELDSTRKSISSTVSISTSNSNAINQAREPLSSSRSNIISQLPVSQQVVNTSGSNIISQLPVEERFNVVSTPAPSNQSRSLSSEQLTNVNRETNSQQVLATREEPTPQQGVVLGQAGNSQQATDLRGNIIITQATTDNPCGYGNSYRNLPIDARNSLSSQQLFGRGYNTKSLYNRDAGKKMADHFLYLSRLGTRIDHNSFTPEMLKWLYEWSYINNREYHNKAFNLGLKYPNYKKLSIGSSIRNELVKLD